MKQEHLIDRMITDIMEDFDFEKVHNIMMSLDWKWDIGNGETTVPSIYRITSQAERLLRDAAKDYGKKDHHTISSGGFTATLYEDMLTLSFELEEVTVFPKDYNENSK
jgi:hypothetical protein